MSTNLRFYLKEPNAIRETLLLLRIDVTRTNRIKISTGIKIHPDDWNGTKQTVKRTNQNYSDYNALLNQLLSEYKSLCVHAAIQQIPITKEYLQSKSRFSTGTQTTGEFFEAYTSFLNSKKQTIAPRSYIKYERIKNHLQEFSVKKNYKLNFDTINQDFYKSFCDYMLYDVGNMNNSTAKTIKFLKTFLNYAFERGYHKNIEYKKFKLLKDVDTEIIALNADELKAIQELQDLPDHLRRARDLFLILCFTSLRYSDLENLQGKKFKNGLISIFTQKTKEAINVHLHPRLENVLSKYLDKNGAIALPELSNQKMNAYLKEIGKLAELNDTIKKVRMKGGQPYETIKEKWELISTHTGRRTFTTLSLFWGMDAEAVKKITGHKNDASFKKYVRYSDMQLKDKIEKVWK